MAYEMKEFDLTQYYKDFNFTVDDLINQFDFYEYKGQEYKYADITLCRKTVKFFDKYFYMLAHYSNNVLVNIRLVPNLVKGFISTDYIFEHYNDLENPEKIKQLQEYNISQCKDFLIEIFGNNFKYEDLVWRDLYRWSFPNFSISFLTHDIESEFTRIEGRGNTGHISILYAQLYLLTYPNGSRELKYFPKNYKFDTNDGIIYEKVFV